MEKLTNSEIVDLERMCRMVCVKYEQTIKNYDGTISTEGKNADTFKKYNALHERILSEMESRLNKYL